MRWDLFVNSCVVVAELIVAAVIYLEVRHSRSVDFLEKSRNFDANEDRREIYNAFLKLNGDLETRAMLFCEAIQKADTEDSRALKKRCERQIALFNDLGFSCRKPLWSLRGQREDKLVSLLPHATIYMWLIFKPYILKRRKDTGPWYATPLLGFALRSINYVLCHRPEQGLRFSLEGSEGDFEITIADLKANRDELGALLGRRWTMKLWFPNWIQWIILWVGLTASFVLWRDDGWFIGPMTLAISVIFLVWMVEGLRRQKTYSADAKAQQSLRNPHLM